MKAVCKGRLTPMGRRDTKAGLSSPGDKAATEAYTFACLKTRVQRQWKHLDPGFVMGWTSLSNSFWASGPAPPKLIFCTLLQNIPTRDRLEGMAAFREKRPPKFVGE